MDSFRPGTDNECTEGFAICVRHFSKREGEGGEYAKLVLISEKATELNEQRKEEERSSHSTTRTAVCGGRRVGMGSCKLKRRRGRGRGGLGARVP